MKNLQLFDSLKTLNKNEFREFEKFVNSPYFNNRSEVTRFFAAVKKHYPDFRPESINEEKIFSKVYPGKKFSNVLMRKLVSLTSNLMFEFTAIKGFRDDKLGFGVKLLYTLYDMNLSAMFEKQAKKMKTVFKTTLINADYYDYKFKYTSKVNGYFSEIDAVSTIPKFQNELDDFVEYFIITSLIIYHRLIAYSSLYNVSYDMKFYDEVMGFVKTGGYKDNLLITMYYYMIMLFDSENEEYFFKMKDFWKKNKSALVYIFQNNIYVGLLNFSINRIKAGDFKYRKLLFEITNEVLKEDIILKGTGRIQSAMFSAIIRNAASLKEFEWIDNFIKKYTQHLASELTNESLIYAYAVIEFEKGNFKRSLKNISSINIEKLILKINAKNLTIMNYYELKYFDELESFIDAYKHFLKREKSVTDYYHTNINLLIKYVIQLIKLSSNKDLNSATLLKKQLENIPYFILKEWILEKTNELIKKSG